MIPVDVLGNRHFLSLHQQFVFSEGYLFLIFGEAATAESAAETVTAFGVQIVSFELFKAFFLSLFKLEVDKS